MRYCTDGHVTAAPYSHGSYYLGIGVCKRRKKQGGYTSGSLGHASVTVVYGFLLFGDGSVKEEGEQVKVLRSTGWVARIAAATVPII